MQKIYPRYFEAYCTGYINHGKNDDGTWTNPYNGDITDNNGNIIGISMI